MVTGAASMPLVIEEIIVCNSVTVGVVKEDDEDLSSI